MRFTASGGRSTVWTKERNSIEELVPLAWKSQCAVERRFLLGACPRTQYWSMVVHTNAHGQWPMLGNTIESCPPTPGESIYCAILDSKAAHRG